MTAQLVPGTIVRLRSGGPSMTVESINDQGMVHCVWFLTGRGQLADRAFAAGSLEPVPAKIVRIRGSEVSGSSDVQR
jgi:uncharacterized protein YodC (DUF2158 family)